MVTFNYSVECTRKSRVLYGEAFNDVGLRPVSSRKCASTSQSYTHQTNAIYTHLTDAKPAGQVNHYHVPATRQPRHQYERLLCSFTHMHTPSTHEMNCRGMKSSDTCSMNYTTSKLNTSLITPECNRFQQNLTVLNCHLSRCRNGFLLTNRR